jgi:hypothetical protein
MNKAESLPKILKSERPFYPTSVVDQLPVRSLCV